jgi:hypothetical protein
MTSPESLKATLTKNPVTAFTALASVAWMLSMILRAAKPDLPFGPAADGLMTTMAGYWFTDKGKKTAP